MKPASTGRRWVWVILGAGAYGLHLALGKDSALVENVYSRGFFVGLRRLWDLTLGRSPVPLIYVLLAAVVLRGVWLVIRLKRSRGVGPEGCRPSHLTPEEYRSDIYVPTKVGPVPTRIGRALLIVASWAGALVFLFYALWGFNYNRVGLEKQLRLEAAPVDIPELRAEAEGTALALAKTRASIVGATKAALPDGVLPHDLEAAVRSTLAKVLDDAGFPAPGRPRVRPLWPGGLLMRLSSSGFYFPYGGEGYTARNLTAAEKPFVTAHEMSHAYGITDEGAANFLGFLACEAAPDPAVRYSGLLSYWEYLFPALARASAEDARRLAARLPEAGGVRADLRAALENWDRFRGPVRAAAQAVYERYLKSQGIAEGAKSYDRFVSLVVAWKRRSGQ
ncbi:MAG TPA: DUF3810 domain-containing protein [Terriglobales bacterium]|nr:DUF3810 domain-containing protein [Terriglobales bacterium]